MTPRDGVSTVTSVLSLRPEDRGEDRFTRRERERG